MSLLEGGSLKCSRHKFETSDVEKWNKHCSDGDHFEDVETVCTSCGEPLEVTGLPFQPFKNGSKNISVKCDDCDKQSRGKAKVNRKGKDKK